MTSHSGHEHHHPLILAHDPLTINTVEQVARHNRAVNPLPDTAPPGSDLAGRLARVDRSAAWVRQAVDEIETAAADGRDPRVIYAVNTGFGDNAGRAVFADKADTQRLSRNLLLTHAVAVGDHLPPDVVRATLLIRAHTLAQGYSGVRREVINTLVDMLNRGVLPAMPAQGSLGASGDLAPLAHLALVMSAPVPGEQPHPGANGQAYWRGALVDGAAAMAEAGIPRVVLGAKEGVALINGTAATAGIAALAWADAFRTLAASEITLVLSMEALRGFRDAYLPHLHAVRGHTGQQQVAQFVYRLLEGSDLVRGDAHIDLDSSDGPPQDPYCLRAAPVVLGAVLDTVRYVEDVITREINAVTDNPLIFADTDGPLSLPRAIKAVSGGNFHGAPIGYAMDFLKITMADLASISERRTFTLTDARLNRGLPSFLIDDPPGKDGINSGLMLAQYTAASLVSESKTLAHPASVDSIPSSANREDHVSMCTTAARLAAAVVANTQVVIAIELLCAFQALALRQRQNPDARLGRGALAVMDFLRTVEIAPGHTLDMLTEDVALQPYLTAMIDMVRRGALLDVVHALI
ncbi:MAG: aromatic amino acid lyase [Anaerolineae bacterium]|nr:aromatic amino acid lyase [Anaerolineae bacterium]